MKKVIFIKSARLGVSPTLLVLLCLLLGANVEAQTVQSAQYIFPSCRGISVIVRESSAGIPVIVHHHIISNDGAGFLYGNIATNAAKMFVIPDTTFVDSYVNYKVKDMRVVGDMCYFCGVRVREHYEGSMLVFDSIGVLGRFHLPTSGFDQSVKHDLKLIHETKSLDRMAAFADYSDTVLAMIGIVDNPASESCLTVARVNNTAQWKYYVEYTNNSVVEEVFTDIAVDPKNVTIASYHKNGEGMHHFNLRISDNYDVQNDTYSYFDILNKYTPILMTMPNPCFTLARPDFAAIRLCVEPNDSKVYAAFACYNSAMLPAYPTGVCKIETDSKILLSAQIVQKAYMTPHTLVDVAYLDATVGSGAPASVALLHQTDGMYKTVVEYPYADISSYGPSPVALVQQKADEMLSSVFAHDRDNVRFGGILDHSTKKLTYLQEILPPLADKYLCIESTEANIMTSNDAQAPESVPSPLLQKTDSMKDLNWGHKTAVSEEINAENICIHYKN